VKAGSLNARPGPSAAGILIASFRVGRDRKRPLAPYTQPSDIDRGFSNGELQGGRAASQTLDIARFSRIGSPRSLEPRAG
jgi:hypothetical protein